jgi:hypothetical protein
MNIDNTRLDGTAVYSRLYIVQASSVHLDPPLESWEANTETKPKQEIYFEKRYSLALDWDGGVYR